MLRVHYYRSPHGNFGDDLNAWMWNSLIPEEIGINSDFVMVGVGTLLNIATSKSFSKETKWAAIGSGAGYGSPPIGLDRNNWENITVRGPLTAQVLGMSPDHAVTDGAILLADLAEGRPVIESERQGVVMMPHVDSPNLPLWREACRRAGITYIDPTADSIAIMRVLKTAKLVLADAMHAAIVSDTVRVPWVPLVSYDGISMFKWLDWTSSMNVPYEPHILPVISARTTRKNADLHAFGLAGIFDDRTVEGAIAHYKRSDKAATTVSGRAVRKFRRVAHKSLRKLQVFDAEPIDEAGIDRVAKALEGMKSASGYLSENGIFDARKEQMRARLRSIVSAASQNM